MDRVVIEFFWENGNKKVDLDIPLNLTAYEFIQSVNQSLQLKMDVSDISKYSFQGENPIVLIKGSRTLEELGIVEGTRVYYT